MGPSNSTVNATQPLDSGLPSLSAEAVFQVADFSHIKFLWVQPHSALLHRLSFNVVREVCSYLHREEEHRIPVAVWPTEMRYFDISTGKWQPPCSLSQEIYVYNTSSIALLRDNQVFVCGGEQRYRVGYPANSAYVLNRNGTVHVLPHMSCNRNSPGSVYDYWTNTVYVFGGYRIYPGSDLRSGEKFMFASFTWERLPKMHKGRFDFNPCIYSGVVYLCGGQSSPDSPPCVETYDPKSNLITLLPDFVVDPGNCIAVVQNGVLTVASDNFSYSWDLQEKKGAPGRLHTPLHAWSRCTPVVSGGKVFIVDERDRCVSINLETGDTEQTVEQNQDRGDDPQMQEWEWSDDDSNSN